MHLGDVHTDMIELIDIMEEEVREPFASPEAQGRQIEQPLNMRVPAHHGPLVREDKGEMQEGRRRQIPAEQKNVRQAMRGLKIKDGHEEAKPDHAEAQKPPTARCVRTEQKDPHSTQSSGGVCYRLSKASRREDLQVEEPVACWDCSSFDFHPTLPRMLSATLIWDQVVQVGKPCEKRLLAPL